MPATVTHLTARHPEPQPIPILIAPGDPAGYPITDPDIDGSGRP